VSTSPVREMRSNPPFVAPLAAGRVSPRVGAGDAAGVATTVTTASVMNPSGPRVGVEGAPSVTGGRACSSCSFPSIAAT
jgi:hypothetical protein